MAALVDIVGMLFSLLLLGIHGFKEAHSAITDYLVNGVFIVFFFPAGPFSPILWAIVGFFIHKIWTRKRNTEPVGSGSVREIK